MAGYSSFAGYYDQLTQNVDYKARATYFSELIRLYQPATELVLDLACGTGSLSVELAALGYNMTAADGSADMLSFAMQKAAEREADILFLCQPMERLDLYGTVDTAICALDSLNHLNKSQLLRALERLQLFVAPGGLFIFDVNTVYKHRNILADNCFVYELDDLFCVWQNSLLTEDAVEVSLDFFVQQSGSSYRRESECFREYIYPEEFLRNVLADNSFEVLDIFAEDSTNPPKADSQRLVYVARRLGE